MSRALLEKMKVLSFNEGNFDWIDGPISEEEAADFENRLIPQAIECVFEFTKNRFEVLNGVKSGKHYSIEQLVEKRTLELRLSDYQNGQRFTLTFPLTATSFIKGKSFFSTISEIFQSNQRIKSHSFTIWLISMIYQLSVEQGIFATFKERGFRGDHHLLQL